MSSDDKTTSEPAEASPADEQQREESPESTDWRAENTRLRQQLKKVQDLNREALPFAQLGVALQQAKGGEAIIAKLQKGEPLTAAQEAKLEEAQKETGTTGLTEERVQEILQGQAKEFEQRLWETRKAERAMEKLNQWAAKKYPGWEEVFESDQWNQRLNATLANIEAGILTVPDDQSDIYKFAWDETAAWLKGLNPDIGKKKPAKKTEKERREAIKATSVEAGGVTPEDSEEIPEYARLDTKPRFLGGGRSFRSLKRS